MSELVSNSMNEFYKLKSKYETQITKNKKQILNNPMLSTIEKKNEFKKLIPKCINCKRAGGTIFSNKADTEGEFKILKAMCGVISDPCNLNITIQLGKYESISDILRDLEKIIKDAKDEIIDDKNKLLFGFYTTETALDKFNELKDIVSEFTSMLEQYLILFLKITDNKELQQNIEKEIEISYEFIQKIKDSIKNFNTSNNIQFIKDSVNIYIDNLQPLLGTIASLKYKENFVWYNASTSTYHLIQNKYTIKDLEHNSGDDKLIKYDVGLKIQEKGKRQKNPNIQEKLKIKKPLLIIEESTEKEEEEEEPEAEIPQDIPQDIPQEKTQTEMEKTQSEIEETKIGEENKNIIEGKTQSEGTI